MWAPDNNIQLQFLKHTRPPITLSNEVMNEIQESCYNLWNLTLYFQPPFEFCYANLVFFFLTEGLSSNKIYLNFCSKICTRKSPSPWFFTFSLASVTEFSLKWRLLTAEGLFYEDSHRKLQILQFHAKFLEQGYTKNRPSLMNVKKQEQTGVLYAVYSIATAFSRTKKQCSYNIMYLMFLKHGYSRPNTWLHRRRQLRTMQKYQKENVL